LDEQRRMAVSVITWYLKLKPKSVIRQSRHRLFKSSVDFFKSSVDFFKKSVDFFKSSVVLKQKAASAESIDQFGFILFIVY